MNRPLADNLPPPGECDFDVMKVVALLFSIRSPLAPYLGKYMPTRWMRNFPARWHSRSAACTI